MSQKFHGHVLLVFAEIEFNGLGAARKIDHAEDFFIAPFAHIGQDLAVSRFQEFQGAIAEGAVGLARGNEALDPVEQ